MSQGVKIKSRTKLMYHRTGMLHGPWLDKASVLIYINEVDHLPAAGVDTVLLIIVQGRIELIIKLLVRSLLRP